MRAHRVPVRARWSTPLVAVVLLLVAAACGETVQGHSLSEPAPSLIRSYISHVISVGQHGKSHWEPSALPLGSIRGPSVHVPESATVINGGSVRETVELSQPAKSLRIALRPIKSEPLPSTTAPTTYPSSPTLSSPSSATPSYPSSPRSPSSSEYPSTAVSSSASPAPPSSSSAYPSSSGPSSVPASSTAASTAASPSTDPAKPAAGYNQLDLDAPSDSVAVVLTVSRTLPGDFVIYFAAVAADGTQSVVATQRVRRVSVGSGDVQVSVSWDTPTDTDLHVIEPDGTELWARNGRAETLPSTGHLDLDSNQSCDIDGTDNENATWQHAPPGHYIVRVVYYSVCGTTNVTTHYVVTVQVVGHPTQVVDGTFGPDDADAGEAGAGRTVATFDVA